jgi:4'-phosphopantetheinyl transferase
MKVMDRVYICKIEQGMVDEERYAFFYSKLPEGRRKKVNNYVFDQDKVQSMISYLLFVAACQRNGIYFTEQDILYSIYGKPYFRNQKNIHFNISNCRSAVCCGISAYPIGVDVESTIVQIDDLMNLCMHPNEIEKIRSVQKREDLFTKYWTLKESFLKCQGVGLNGDIRELDFSQFSQCNEFNVYGKSFCSLKFDKLCVAVCSFHDIKYEEINILELERDLAEA